MMHSHKDAVNKIVISARFVKENDFIFNVKWRHRADKFALGITLDDPAVDDLWEPVQGANFDDCAKAFIYDTEDRNQAIEECFDEALANTLESDDRPTLNREEWLEANKQARLDNGVISPLGNMQEVPRQLYVDKWRTRLTPLTGDSLKELKGRASL